MADIEATIERIEQAMITLMASENADDLYSSIVTLAAEVFRKDICYLYRFDASANAFAVVARHDRQLFFSDESIPMGVGIVGWVGAHGTPLYVPDIKSDPRGKNTVTDAQSAVSVPLKKRDQLFGVLDIQSRRPNAFSSTDTSLIRVFAQYVSTTIAAHSEGDRFKVEKNALKDRLWRYEMIHRISKSLMAQTNFEMFAQILVDAVAAHIDASRVSFLLYDPDLDELEVISTYNFCDVIGLRLPASKGLTGYAVRHREPVNIGDVVTDPRYQKSAAHGRSELVIPIFGKDGVVGVIDLESTIPNAFSKDDVAMLLIVSTLAAAAIATQLFLRSATKERMTQRRVAHQIGYLHEQKAGKQKKINHQASCATLLSRIVKSVGSRLTMTDMYEEVVRLCAEAFNFNHCDLWLKSDDGTEMVLKASLPPKPPAIAQNRAHQQNPQKALPGEVLRSGTPILVTDLTKGARNMTGLGDCRAEMAVPIFGLGEAIGVLDGRSKADDAFDERDLALFESFAAQVAVAIAHERATNEKREDAKD